jgi:hypothetical protein
MRAAGVLAATMAMRLTVQQQDRNLAWFEITDTAADQVARADAWSKAVAFIRKLGAPE